MAYNIRNKYRLRLSDGTYREMWFIGDMDSFKQFLDGCARRNRHLVGTIPKTARTADWPAAGKRMWFYARNVVSVQQIGSEKGVYDRRDVEFYRMVRIGQFWYEGKIHELEWMAEDFRYKGKNKKNPLGTLALNGGGRMYSMDDFTRGKAGTAEYLIIDGVSIVADSDADGLPKAEKDLSEKRKAVDEAYYNVNTEDVEQSLNLLAENWEAIGLPETDITDLNAIISQLASDIAELSDTKIPFEEGRLAIYEVVPVAEIAQGTLKIALDEAANTEAKLNAFVGETITDVRKIKEYSAQAENEISESIERLNTAPSDAERASKVLKDAAKHLNEAANKLSDAAAKLTDGSLEAINEEKLNPAQILLLNAKSAVNRALEKLNPPPPEESDPSAEPDIEGTIEDLNEAKGYLEDVKEVLEEAITALDDIRTSVLELLSSLRTALTALSNNLTSLSKAIKDLRDASNALRELKAKRYYAPERGWRVPRESDFAMLASWAMGATAVAQKYNTKGTVPKMADPKLSKLLSETWPYYNASGKIGLWPNHKRIGFDAVAHRQPSAGAATDFWSLRKIKRVEEEVNGEKVATYAYAFGYFTISTAKGSDTVKVSHIPLSGIRKNALRLVRTVLKYG